MLILHRQGTGPTPLQNLPPPSWVDRSIQAARNSSIPSLYEYQFVNGTVRQFPMENYQDPNELRDRERLEIHIHTKMDGTEFTTKGWFIYRQERVDQAVAELLATIFILLLWLMGVNLFAGPVMVLVVLPIERMVRLLGMLMLDP